MSLEDTLTYDPMPEDVASWLAGRSWHRITQGAGHAALWTQGSLEVLQPTIKDAPDYDLRFSEMLRRLAMWTEQSGGSLAQEMIAEGSDITEWRAENQGSRDFSIPLEDGAILVQSIRNATVAAANAAVQRRGYFGHSTLKIARDHARSVRMGQTRRGSYVVPVISHIPGSTEQIEDQQDRFDLEVSAQPFERRAMAQLAQALATIEHLAVDSGSEPSMKQLNESVGNGVSYELCSALASALNSTTFGDLDITFSWARRVPQHPSVVQIQLPKQAGSTIGRMADHLRGSNIVGEQTVTGYVRSHRREPDEEEGSIFLRAPIGDKLRTIGMTLTGDQLHEALVAAADRRPVSVRGRLVREQGRAWRFESITGFGSVQAIDLPERPGEQG